MKSIFSDRLSRIKIGWGTRQVQFVFICRRDPIVPARWRCEARAWVRCIPGTIIKLKNHEWNVKT